MKKFVFMFVFMFVFIFLFGFPDVVNAYELKKDLSLSFDSFPVYGLDFIDSGFVISTYNDDEQMDSIMKKFNFDFEEEWISGICDNEKVVEYDDFYLIIDVCYYLEDDDGYEFVTSQGVLTKVDKNGKRISSKKIFKEYSSSYASIELAFGSNDELFLVKKYKNKFYFLKYNTELEQISSKEISFTNINDYLFFDDNLYIVGENNNDAFISKLDKNGEVCWSNTVSGSKVDSFNSVTINNNKELVVIGNTTSTDISDLGTYPTDYGILLYSFDKDGSVLSRNVLNNDDSYLNKKIYYNSKLGYIVGPYVYENLSNGKKNLKFLILDNNMEFKKEIIYSDEFGSNILLNDFEFYVDNNANFYIGFYRSYSLDNIQKLYIDFNVELFNNKGGNVVVNKSFYSAELNIDLEDGYLINEVIVKDSENKIVDVKKVSDLQYTFDLYDDVTVEVKFVKDYKITLNTGVNGSATAEKLDGDSGRVNVVPRDGYELDEIVIKDSTGKEVVYEEKDGYYYFDIQDDLVINVTFKELPKEVVKNEEENPKTADAFIYYACAVVCSLFGIWSVEQYRKNLRV